MLVVGLEGFRALGLEIQGFGFGVFRAWGLGL